MKTPKHQTKQLFKRTFYSAIFFICGFISAIPLGAQPADPKVVFVQPVVENDKKAFKTKEQQKYPILEEIAPGDEILQTIVPVLSSGMPQISVHLDTLAKNFMLVQLRTGSPDSRSQDVFKEPLYICLVQGGNSPKQGFFLKRAGELLDKTSAYFIEMPRESLPFEKIFSHEHGHLLDAYISDFEFRYFPHRPPHTTPAVTDFQTAYSEGWGNHFELLTGELTQNVRLKNTINLDDLKGRLSFLYIGDLLTLSQNMKRHYWVKSGLFVFKRGGVIEDGLESKKAQENFSFNWTNYNFLGGELKNSQQMLCSEGVIAGIFYQIVHDPALQNRYANADFYKAFLDGNAEDFKNRISPLENIYLKMLYAKHSQFNEYRERRPKVPGPLLLDFITTYIRLFPEDANDILLHFAMGTFFTTVNRKAHETYKKTDAAAHLMIYDMETAKSTAQNLLKETQDTMDSIKASHTVISANIGEPLWIENNKFNPEVFGEQMEALSINLNAAEAFELMTLPGMTIKQAEALIEDRDKNGFFTNIQDLQRSRILNPRQHKDLEKMRALFYGLIR